MRVTNNFNRFPNQSFGMALKIKKGADKFLHEQSLDTLKRLASEGEKMKSFKFWDLEVDQNGLRVASEKIGNAYRNPMLRFRSDELLGIDAVYDGNNASARGGICSIIFELKDSRKAARECAKIKNMKGPDELYIELTKLLEADAIEEFTADAQKEQLISKLINKFGTK